MHARRKGAIIIAPDYPLGPEGNYADICDSIRDFLRWYKENGYFKDETDSKSESWQKWITKKIDKTNITIDKDRVYVEGESAGGHAAVMALWINAAHDGPKLSIKSCLLRYPMLAHYARGFPKDKGKIVYMGESFTPSDVTKRAHDVVAAIDELEEWGLVPTRSKGYAPQYMSATFLLSLTKLWQPVFQRKHGKKIGSRGTIDPSVPDYMDCLDRVDKCVNSVDHNYLPPIGMYHGVQDTNCPIENTRIFQSILKEKYPVYQKKNAVFLHEVSYLNWKYSLVQAGKGGAKKADFTWQRIDKVEHAFDYDLDIAREPFLQDTYATIDEFWRS
jgi:acetyl esterase/lipase